MNVHTFQGFSYLFTSFVCVCVCLSLCALHIGRYPWSPEENNRFPGTAVKGDWELPNVGGRDQIILYERIIYFKLN